MSCYCCCAPDFEASPTPLDAETLAAEIFTDPNGLTAAFDAAVAEARLRTAQEKCPGRREPGATTQQLWLFQDALLVVACSVGC